MMRLTLVLVLALGSAQPVEFSADCSPSARLGELTPFWRSCGYTPATYALRDDELENTANIGTVPRRGVTQVRIHFLLDLVEVLGWTPSPSTPSGWLLSYSWGALDHAIDFLVASNLSPGFEMMGSPMGFPSLPLSFWTVWDGNGKISTAQTLCMYRQLIGDLLQRAIARYGRAEVESWHLESTNEPDQGWGWPQLANTSDPVLASYVSAWDAITAGVADAEAATNSTLYFGGTASGRAAGDKFYLPAILNHVASGRNQFTGAPVRLDYITAHVKGESTSYVTVLGEWAVSALIRSSPAWVAAGLGALAVSNDEGDPMVGWEVPEDWRGDARYAAIIPKMVNQHLLAIADNRTGNNPLGWLSFDGAFMNGVGDNYTGFGERTLTARFGGPAANAPGGSPVAFVRKSGLAAFGLLARMPSGAGSARCAVAAAPPAGAPVFAANSGALASIDAAAGDAAIIIYNSADCANATAPALAVTTSVAGLPFAAGPADGSVVAVRYVIDDTPARSAQRTWLAQGSPPLPAPAQLLALWAAAAAAAAADAAPLPVAVAAGGAVTLPAVALPLPGVLLWHVAARAAAPAPPAPAAPVAFAKAPAASLLDAASQREVFLRWDCAAAPRTVLAYRVQYAADGAAWADANTPGDAACVFMHAAPAATYGNASAYRVAAIDYWQRQGEWSAAAAVQPWPHYGE